MTNNSVLRGIGRIYYLDGLAYELISKKPDTWKRRPDANPTGEKAIRK